MGETDSYNTTNKNEGQESMHKVKCIDPTKPFFAAFSSKQQKNFYHFFQHPLSTYTIIYINLSLFSLPRISYRCKRMCVFKKERKDCFSLLGCSFHEHTMLLAGKIKCNVLRKKNVSSIFFDKLRPRVLCSMLSFWACQ